MFLMIGIGAALLLLFAAFAIASDSVLYGAESQFVLFVDVVVVCLIAYYGFDVSILTLLIALIVNATIGVVYTVFSLWPRWIKSKESKIRNDYKAWKKSFGTRPDDDFYESNLYYKTWSAKSNIGMISVMIFLWPFDLLYQITFKPVKWVVYALSSIFDRQLNKIVKTEMERKPNDKRST